MQMIYFRANEGVRKNNSSNGHLSSNIPPSGPWWTGLGSDRQVGSPPSPSKSLKSNEESMTQFTIVSGDCKDLMSEHRLKLGFSHPVSCDKYRNIDPCYGLFSASGPHLSGSMMLPLKSSEGLVIYVNPKQYPAIIRRRESRARAEHENRLLRVRKPYMHESRHLHAKRRPRGCGGRFLNAKSSENGKAETGEKKSFGHCRSSSQCSEVLESGNGALNSSRRGTDSRAGLSVHNEVTSTYSSTDSVVDHSRWPFHL